MACAGAAGLLLPPDGWLVAHGSCWRPERQHAVVSSHLAGWTGRGACGWTVTLPMRRNVFGMGLGRAWRVREPQGWQGHRECGDTGDRDFLPGASGRTEARRLGARAELVFRMDGLGVRRADRLDSRGRMALVSQWRQSGRAASRHGLAPLLD